VRTRTVVLSLLFHAGLAATLLGAASHRGGRRPIAVALSEAKKKDKEKPKPPKPPPLRTVVRPPIERKVATVAKVLETAPTPSATPRAAVTTALTMSNDDAPGGIALPTRAPVATAPPTRVASSVTEARRQRMRDAIGPGPGEDAPCNEEPTRPEPVFKQEIEYLAQARADGVEGKLKLRLTVAADGTVVKVDVLQSMSAEMDAAAAAAAKQWRFKPAMACGHPIAGGTYVLARTFELGD
jgi:periplasmic protein TonB